jgi:multidrug resistance efflux pump
MKRLLRVIVLLLLIGGGYYYYIHLPEPDSLTLTGIVTTENVIVSPQVGGKIGQLLVKEGDVVHRDQVIAVMTSDELMADRNYYENVVESIGSQVGEGQAALRLQEQQTEDRIVQAQANLDAAITQQKEAAAALENAAIALERAQKMLTQGVGPQQEVDRAKTAYDAAKTRVDTMASQMEAQRAAVAVAKADLSQLAVQQNRIQTTQRQRAAASAQRQKADVRLAYSEVRAPADGMVDVRAAREGEVVNPGQAIVTLVNPDDLWVRADVEETYIDRIRVGDKLNVRLPSGDVREGVVFYRAVDAIFATQSDVSRTMRYVKTFEIRLRVDNVDRRLAVGMTMYIDLSLKAQ